MSGQKNNTASQNVWAAGRLAAAGLVSGLFPFVFLLDAAVETNTSPVLPLLAALVFLLVVLPFVVSELGLLRLRRAKPEKREMIGVAWRQRGRFLLALGLVWFATWMVLGA